ncbi:cobalamin-dependent protein [Streptomyces albidus (ex Kaewkla and Franco 2022)]|uniref:cobalamin-dependent protein n=1 Tax=Streptomyces albidus (ex Kaewkla and Franco 2022) TaxID=722709 RepID=UPI0015EF2CF3|nr:cobalamin-dependent protein [Streptomyces albidus (ex Kaewkla and Franco 2022)]
MTGAMGRVILAKVGLDGHDVGVNLVAKTLVDAGFEVVYLGKRVSTDQIVGTAVDEDAEFIGVSCLSGGLGHFAVNVVERLREEGVDIPVIAGGIDEPGEIEKMLSAGVHRHLGPGSSREKVVEAFVSARDARAGSADPGPC